MLLRKGMAEMGETKRRGAGLGAEAGIRGNHSSVSHSFKVMG
jgi:hypothetical protein